MPIYALGEQEPDIHPDAYVHPDAVLIGSVVLGADSSVWPGTVIRADDAPIVIGDRTSVQDGTVVHTTYMHHTTIGSDVVIGHINQPNRAAGAGLARGIAALAGQGVQWVTLDELRPVLV